jgi:transcriptional regulator with XRE-family HTH domain
MEELSAAVTSVLREQGLSQRQLAERAGVSQATVSRAKSQLPLRPGYARGRLIAYLRRQGQLPSLEAIFTAVDEIWDGSEAHADALAQLLLASRELWPKLREG